MIPEVDFRYSQIYDKNIRNWTHATDPRIPSPQEVNIYSIAIGKIWKKEENQVLKEISKITKLNWSDEKIPCYIVGPLVSFSDPLTVPCFRTPEEFIDNLVHEMIHQIFVQDYERCEDALNYFHKKYSHLSETTTMHIPVHAVHKYIFLKFYGEERLEDEIQITSLHPEYKDAWDVVKKEGFENIINEFVKRLK